jgi:hypothetical protein
MIPTPKFKRSFPVTKLREPKVRKYISDKITPDSLITKRMTVDCGPKIEVETSTGATAYPEFSGYRFVRELFPTSPSEVASSPMSTLYWNDGVFWSYGNNFNELPLQYRQAIRTSNGAGDMSVDHYEQTEACTTTALIQNRQLNGGSMVLYVNDPTTPYLTNFDMWAIDQPQSFKSPFVGINGANKIHQYDQKVDLLEEMVFTDFPQLNPSEKMMYPCPVPPFNKGFNMMGNSVSTGNAGDGYSVAQMKMMEAFQFMVRNIVLMVPANFPFNEGDPEFGTIGDTWKKPQLENAIMQILFQKTESGFGPPAGDNQDLNRKINPKFKILRDWKQKYAFSGGATPTKVKTKFYHRYNHSIPTECLLEDTYTNTNANVPYDKINAAIPTDADGDADDLQGPAQNAEYYTTAAVADNQAEMMREGVEDGEIVSDEEGIEVPRVTDTQAVNENLRVFNPQTHRIVWLKLPRFAGGFELSDINTGAYSPTTFLNQKGTQYCLAQCGTRMRGYTEWNILKPEVTNTGGVSCGVPITEPDNAARQTFYAHANLET